jgi:hypothetical protein
MPRVPRVPARDPVARYSNFRRFAVTIEDEKASLPSPEP